MKNSGYGPVPTKGTKSTTENIHAKPVSKGLSAKIGAGARSKTDIVKRKGIQAKVTKHGFLANKREYE